MQQPNFLVWAFREHARILRVTLSNRLQYALKIKKKPLFYFLYFLREEEKEFSAYYNQQPHFQITKHPLQE